MSKSINIDGKVSLAFGALFVSSGILAASASYCWYTSSNWSQISEKKSELSKKVLLAIKANDLRAYATAANAKNEFENQPLNNSGLLGILGGTGLVLMGIGGHGIYSSFNRGQSQPQPTNSSAPTPLAQRKKRSAGNKPA